MASPSSGRTSPAWPTRCATCCPPFPPCFMAALAPPGRAAVGHAHGLQTHLGALRQDRSLPLDFDSFFRRCWRSSTRRATSSRRSACKTAIGQMSELLGIGYDVLALDLTESESRHRALVSDPTPPAAQPALPSPTAGTPTPPGAASSIATPAAAAGPPPASPPASEPTCATTTRRLAKRPRKPGGCTERSAS